MLEFKVAISVLSPVNLLRLSSCDPEVHVSSLCSSSFENFAREDTINIFGVELNREIWLIQPYQTFRYSGKTVFFALRILRSHGL